MTVVSSKDAARRNVFATYKGELIFSKGESKILMELEKLHARAAVPMKLPKKAYLKKKRVLDM